MREEHRDWTQYICVLPVGVELFYFGARTLTQVGQEVERYKAWFLDVDNVKVHVIQFKSPTGGIEAEFDVV
jgi:hypothetical protein